MLTKVIGSILVFIGGGPPLDDFMTGGIIMFGGAAAPTGWLLCDGSEVSRATYGDLFNIIGTTFGVGNGTTTFNLPNFEGVSPVGPTAQQSLGSRDPKNGLIRHAHNFTADASDSDPPSDLTNVVTSVTGLPGLITTNADVGSATHTHSIRPSGQTDTEQHAFQIVNFIIKT